MSEPAAAEFEAFVAAVERMRHCQREYFRSRSPASLSAAKAAESKVDKLLAVYDKRSDQRELF